MAPRRRQVPRRRTSAVRGTERLSRAEALGSSRSACLTAEHNWKELSSKYMLKKRMILMYRPDVEFVTSKIKYDYIKSICLKNLFTSIIYTSLGLLVTSCPKSRSVVSDSPDCGAVSEPYV